MSEAEVPRRSTAPGPPGRNPSGIRTGNKGVPEQFALPKATIPTGKAAPAPGELEIGSRSDVALAAPEAPGAMHNPIPVPPTKPPLIKVI